MNTVMSAQHVNGHMSMGPSADAGNGTAADMGILAKIHEALLLIHNPHSANQARQEAQQFLEQVKDRDDAPLHGYNLATNKSQDPIVRHFALSLLEHAIKHKWGDYSVEQATALRQYVLQLSQGISTEDPPYLRIKIAVLWVEVAKRSWAADWMDMDALLLQLWQVQGSAVHKELVLQILETLSEDVFGGDDGVVSLRSEDLSRACVEIVTPHAVLISNFPDRDPTPAVRCNEEGWLPRIAQFLGQCLAGDLQNSDDLRNCTVRALSTLYSFMPWVVPNAMVATGCVPVLCQGLRASHVSVQKAALETMHAFYNRTSFTDTEFRNLVVPLYDRKYIELFTQLFQWSTVDAEDIDDDKYQFGKKLSETISFLGNYMDRRFAYLPSDNELVDFTGFLRLLLLITQSQSLVVSIPTLVTWTRLLNNGAIGPNIVHLADFMGPLMELCSSRQLRYENLPEDTQDPTFLLLHEDTDTIPERHAFLGNYRRYSASVIERIVVLKASEAIPHILAQTETTLEHLYNDQPAFSPANYYRHSTPSLRADAHATVVEAALRGFNKWKKSKPANEQEPAALENNLEAWATRLLAMKFEDPQISKRILQLLVTFSTTALDKNPNFMLKVLEHILMTWPAAQPEHKTYSDAVKDLQSESTVELHRLATKMPDDLLDVYDQIAAKVNEMGAAGTLDEKRHISYQTFLFSIIHRSSANRIDLPTRAVKLMEFITPIVNQWQDPNLCGALTSYAGFCELLALDKAQAYLARKRVHEVKDWGSVELDAEGQALQNDLETRQCALPLRPTKHFSCSSLEKLAEDSDAFGYSIEIWKDSLPIILSELLKFLSHAHASHIPDNWTGLSPEMRSIVDRVLTDRFWQAGISEGTKDDFYARVLHKKNTIEGLASTIRGSIRFIRDSCYVIIGSMSRLGVQFYGMDDLPGPLAHALFADSLSLSTHQMINLLGMTKYLVGNCPVELRDHFFPPVLEACFRQMDAKITSEWEKLDQQQTIQAEGETLTEEMKAESILRQLTHTAVLIVADLLDPSRTNPRDPEGRKFPTLRKFCLMHSSILEPLLLFSTHAIRMRDTRCCGIMLRVFRSVIPDYQPPKQSDTPQSEVAKAEAAAKSTADITPIPEETASVIREYISTNVLQACIQSLHEPYFVELHKEIASLIATILACYSPHTPTPRNVLLSLPGMQKAEVDKAIDRIIRPGQNSRYHRTVILDLLKDLKGVSVSEMGKLNKSLSLPSSSRKPHGKGKGRTQLAQGFMTTPQPAPGTSNNGLGDADALDGVAGLFAQ